MACIARANREAIQKVTRHEICEVGNHRTHGEEPAICPKKPKSQRKEVNMNNAFIKVDEVAQVLGVSKSYAYKIVREMNNDLKQRGFLTIAGRVSKQYFEERFYGFHKIKST
jgi:hypothetical protein